MLTLWLDYTRKMRDAESEDFEGKRKNETLWPVMRISHTRSRCKLSLLTYRYHEHNWQTYEDIYDLYYKRKQISKVRILKYMITITILTIVLQELYDWLLKEGYADAKLVLIII